MSEIKMVCPEGTTEISVGGNTIQAVRGKVTVHVRHIDALRSLGFRPEGEAPPKPSPKPPMTHAEHMIRIAEALGLRETASLDMIVDRVGELTEMEEAVENDFGPTVQALRARVTEAEAARDGAVKEKEAAQEGSDLAAVDFKKQLAEAADTIKSLEGKLAGATKDAKPQKQGQG